MGLIGRLANRFKAKASKALDRAEDPRETLDYSYKRQLELLQGVRRGVADVATAPRLELEELLAAVRERGERLPDDYLGSSDLALPGSDATIEEVRALLTEEGLMPG